MTQKTPNFDEEKISKEEKHILECYSGKKRGTIHTLFRLYKGNYKNLIISALMYVIKSSPGWILPLITASVIDIATQRPNDAIQKFILYGIIALVLLFQNIPTHTIHAMYLSRAQRSLEAGLR